MKMCDAHFEELKTALDGRGLMDLVPPLDAGLGKLLLMGSPIRLPLLLAGHFQYVHPLCVPRQLLVV